MGSPVRYGVDGASSLIKHVFQQWKRIGLYSRGGQITVHAVSVLVIASSEKSTERVGFSGGPVTLYRKKGVRGKINFECLDQKNYWTCSGLGTSSGYLRQRINEIVWTNQNLSKQPNSWTDQEQELNQLGRDSNSFENTGIRRLIKLLESKEDKRSKMRLKTSTRRVGGAFETGLDNTPVITWRFIEHDLWKGCWKEG